MSNNHHTPLALAYARSMLELATERDEADAVARDVEAMQEVLGQTPTFAAFLSDPGIPQEQRSRVLRETFEGKAHPLLFNTVRVMESKGRLRSLGEMLAAYEMLYDQQMGKVEVDVTVAERLDEGRLDRVRQAVSTALGRDAVVHQYVEPDIIGGMILRVQDTLLDGSVRAQLEAMRKRLLNARTTTNVAT